MIAKKDYKFDKRADKYDDGFEGRGSERFYSNLVRQIKLAEGYEVLDVGCGTGTILDRLSKKCNIIAHGIDIEEAMLKQAKEKLPDMDIRKGSCSSLPYADNSMDVITTCMAFHHFDNRKKFLIEAKRVLKTNGILYICDPRFPWIVRRIFDLISFLNNINAKFYSNRELASFVEDNGFYLYENRKDKYVQVLAFGKLKP